ncbi:MAG: hypothetical protein ABJG86_11030 [Nitratireductor sp.]
MTGLALGLALGMTGGEARGFSPTSLFAGGEAGICVLPGTVYGAAYQERTGAAATTPAGHGDPVGTWHDRLTGRYLTAKDDASRPLYQVEVGRHFLLFDGTDDFLRATFAISQPWERVSAIRQVTWSINRRVFSGATANSGILYQSPTTPTLTLYSGGGGPALATLAVGADGVVTERHAGATSRVALDNSAYVTGDAGTIPPGGITIGANYDDSTASNIRLYGVILRAGQMSDTQMAATRGLLAGRGGIAL